MVQDRAGRIWASTFGQGLLLIDPDTRQVRQLTAEKNGLPTNFIQRICPDKAGNLWLGCPGNVIARLNLTNSRVQIIPLSVPAATSPGSIMTI